jgi:hypothetical protein
VASGLKTGGVAVDDPAVFLSKKPDTQVHTIVLALCVVGCLAVALAPRRPPATLPEEDAAILVRGVLVHVLGLDPRQPPAR